VDGGEPLPGWWTFRSVPCSEESVWHHISVLWLWRWGSFSVSSALTWVVTVQVD